MPRVLVPLAEGFEELEAVTITDLLVRAGVSVDTCGLQPGPVTASRGTVILPAISLEEAARHDYDMVVLPGGLPGADHLRDNPEIQAILRKHADKNRYLAAICAAPKALAEAGLLAGKTATAYPGVLDALDVTDLTISGQAIETDGNIITSRGPGTAMDFALQLIETLLGQAKRDEIEAQLVR